MLHKQYVFHRYYHSLQSCYCWIEYIETLYLKCNIHYIIAHEKKKPIAMLRFYIEWEPQTCIRYTLYVTRMYLQSNSNFAKKNKCKININNAFISCLSWLTQRPVTSPSPSLWFLFTSYKNKIMLDYIGSRISISINKYLRNM